MTADEAVDVLMILSAGFPNAYRNLSEQETAGIINLWALQFAEMPKEIVLMAVNKVISTKKPYGNEIVSIAEVHSKIKEIHWEAYDFITEFERVNKAPINDRRYRLHKRIYEATKEYKHYAKTMKLNSMISESGKLRLTGGN